MPSNAGEVLGCGSLGVMGGVLEEGYMSRKVMAALATGLLLSLAACTAVRQEPSIADQLASRAAEVAGQAAEVAAKATCTGFTSHLETQDAYVRVGECTLDGSVLHIMFFNSQSDQQMYVMIAKAAGGDALGYGDRWVIYGSDSAAVEQATRAAGGSTG
jgi:hypothetical protein